MPLRCFFYLRIVSLLAAELKRGKQKTIWVRVGKGVYVCMYVCILSTGAHKSMYVCILSTGAHKSMYVCMYIKYWCTQINVCMYIKYWCTQITPSF